MPNKEQDQERVGTPTMVLLPARNYRFQVVKNEHKITLPRTGKYVEIDSEFFAEEDGSFNLMDGRSKVLYMPAISKVLFATQQYPDLKSNQLFAPVSMKFNKDEVVIVGQVLEMLSPE